MLTFFLFGTKIRKYSDLRFKKMIALILKSRGSYIDMFLWLLDFVTLYSLSNLLILCVVSMCSCWWIPSRYMEIRTLIFSILGPLVTRFFGQTIKWYIQSLTRFMKAKKLYIWRINYPTLGQSLWVDESKDQKGKEALASCAPNPVLSVTHLTTQ